MLTLAVAKTGFESFDALHAYGLCVLLAETYDVEVTLRDLGLIYQVQAPESVKLTGKDVVLSTILSLPECDDLTTAGVVELANLDGLLAASFTTPGIRLVSVNDALSRQHFDQDGVNSGLVKARRLVARIRKACKPSDSLSLLESLLHTYSMEGPLAPVIRPKATYELGVTMPSDASFAYSTRRPHRDGSVSVKTNLTVDGTPHASILVLIGAARCLRAQRVGGNL